MATLEGLVEEMDQLIRVFRGNVHRLGVQGVRDGYGDGYVLAFKGKIPGRAGSLGLVLVRLEVVDNRVGVSFRLLLRVASVCPRSWVWVFVFPLLNHCVASVAEMLGSLQSESVGNFHCHCLALFVSPPYHLSSLVWLLVALLAPVPITSIVLEDSVGRGVITVNGNVEDVSLAPMIAPCVMDVNAPLLGLPLEPFGCDETATVVGIEGSLIS